MSTESPLDNEILSLPAYECAPYFLGALLVSEINGKRVSGKIVEVEAYEQSDAASHSFSGETPRNKAMFGPPGHAYIYFTYGMHYCFNVVTGRKGHGSAILIRAIEPVDGLETMTKRRFGKPLKELANGPAKVCQSFAINKDLNEHNLQKPPLWIENNESVEEKAIIRTTRVGVKDDTHKLWRFYIRKNKFVSKP